MRKPSDIMSSRLNVAAFMGVGLLAVGLGRLVIPRPVGDGRLHDSSFVKLEAQLGRRLWAPTWLPPGMEPADGGSLQGVFRVLVNYENRATETTLIMAQEPRTPARGRYHRRRILPRSGLHADVGGHPGYFLVDATGQRRLFWPTDDSWLIVSSYHMSDEDLLHVARSVR